MLNHATSALQPGHPETQATVHSVRILRLRDVVRKTGMARSTLYDWLNPKSSRYDPSFPKQVMLGRQSVGWLESEIDMWLQQRIADSRGVRA
ncbi:AlpA family transcriptional regulator [Salmonella enterica subsp. enterica]|uniref:AlpA family transcriptional regulator n=1 Tax=Salmonella enterica TaxID=28901 RepID=UPI0012751F36|nr:AlpA family transcriptional regulator [Salmonella enterica subsp. diarizonae]ECN6753440.1 AlpA family transcriptional regulator [Salmonella enterica subsp. enterica serovar Newport]EIZ2109842.1 AlpA family transcriptional regulator [Salmonella enterica]EJU0127746.1 AlpA family transcriptional regulator [Salmonella enterica subsp. enterica serovar Newport]